MRRTPLFCNARTVMSASCSTSRTNLTHFKTPHNVTFVKELPKTATAKIQKCVLRGQLAAIAVVCPLDKHSAPPMLNEMSQAALDGSTFQVLAPRRNLFQELIRRATQRTLLRPDCHNLPFGLGRRERTILD
jgi:hypothetical protein